MSEKEKDSYFERYKLLVTARNFHYDNFNKWQTYFYIANAAIFVGYTQLLTSENYCYPEYVIPILVFGFILGLFQYWSCKGYYYWNINFIELVNYYEKSLLKWDKEERIYSMMANKSLQNTYWKPWSGANYSTSKIAILFSYCVVLAWGTLANVQIIEVNYQSLSMFQSISISLISSVIVVHLIGQLTQFTNRKEKLGSLKFSKKRFKKLLKKKRWFLASNIDGQYDLKKGKSE